MKKTQRFLHAGVLAGGAQWKSVQQAEERGAMALLRPPDKREVAGTGVLRVCLTRLQQFVPPWGDQRIHGREALVDRAFLLVRQEQTGATW